MTQAAIEDELSRIKPQLESLIRQTGAFQKKEFSRFSTGKIQSKAENKNDMVSYVDLESERILKQKCKELLPGAGFINEESEPEPSQNGFRWIIDPLDGTTNFVHGIPHYAISLALQFEEETILGYVYEPHRDEFYYAEKGKGAFLNGNPIQVSQTPKLEHSLLVTGFPYKDYDWLQDFFDLTIRLQRMAHGIRRYGSASLDLCYVAAGRFESFFELTLNAWDIAAGTLIVSEAGGRVTDFEGGDRYLFGQQLIASNALIHDELLSVVQESFHV